MSSETWTSCNMPQKRLEAFFVLRFSHLRAMVFGVCREGLWQPEREWGWAGSHRKEPWLNTGPAPRKERGGLACTDQEELISCDIIELYINNIPEKWVAKHWLTEEAECVKTRTQNYLLLAVENGNKSRLKIWTSGLQHLVIDITHRHCIHTLHSFHNGTNYIEHFCNWRPLTSNNSIGHYDFDRTPE